MLSSNLHATGFIDHMKYKKSGASATGMAGIAGPSGTHLKGGKQSNTAVSNRNNSFHTAGVSGNSTNAGSSSRLMGANPGHIGLMQQRDNNSALSGHAH